MNFALIQIVLILRSNLNIVEYKSFIGLCNDTLDFCSNLNIVEYKFCCYAE